LVARPAAATGDGKITGDGKRTATGSRDVAGVVRAVVVDDDRNDSSSAFIIAGDEVLAVEGDGAGAIAGIADLAAVAATLRRAGSVTAASPRFPP
jgi:hypothetical protein